MDYEAKIVECGDERISTALIAAIKVLLEDEAYLFEQDVHERTIGAFLAFYLRGHFEEFDVDPEFNRLGPNTKRAVVNGVEVPVVPDVIVHKRGVEGPNILVVEIKKGSPDPASTRQDLDKLDGMRQTLGYPFGLFVRFGVRDQAGTITECSWA